MEDGQFDARPPTQTGKADITKRFIAVVIDGVIASVLSWAIPFIGGLLGGLYILLRDGLDVEYLRGRSLGKTLMKLRIVRDNGQPMDLNTSIQRNWPLSVGLIITILLVIPVLGWLIVPLASLVGLVLGVMEIYFVMTDPEGRRFGDRRAGTRVVESAD